MSQSRDCTALSVAAANGHVDVLNYLLSCGANPHQILKDSSTCLLEASKNGETQCVEILLDYGLALEKMNNSSQSQETTIDMDNESPMAHSKSATNIPKVRYKIYT